MGLLWQPLQSRFVHNDQSSLEKSELPNEPPWRIYSDIVELWIPGGCTFKDSRDALNINCDTTWELGE